MLGCGHFLWDESQLVFGKLHLNDLKHSAGDLERVMGDVNHPGILRRDHLDGQHALRSLDTLGK